MNDLTIIEDAVLSLIPIGNGRKISLNELSQLVDIDERSIYSVINSLRMKGVPIGAIRNGPKELRGYYIATNQEELASGIEAYKQQVRDMETRIRYVEQADLEGWQQNIKRPAVNE